MSEKRCCYWVTGLLVGGLVGAVAGLLFAPKSGKETREELCIKAKDVSMRLKDEYEAAIEKSKSAYNALLTRLEELEARAEQKAKEISPLFRKHE
jgi:gas vesicle protein